MEEILDEEVPLDELPPEPSVIDIIDDEVPLDESPKTADQRNVGLMLTLVILALCLLFTLRYLIKDGGLPN